MESLGVLLLHPMNTYLEQELDRRFRLFCFCRFWDSPPDGRAEFLRAVVGNVGYNSDAALIDALPSLENVASFSVGIDRVDLPKCRERGIHVTNTPDVLTDDVADLAISALRKITQADRYVRAGLWKAKGDYTLTTRLICFNPESVCNKDGKCRFRANKGVLAHGLCTTSNKGPGRGNLTMKARRSNCLA